MWNEARPPEQTQGMRRKELTNTTAERGDGESELGTGGPTRQCTWWSRKMVRNAKGGT